MSRNDEQSILSKPGAIAMIATKPILDDLALFFKSIELWNSDLPPIYIACDTAVDKWLKTINYSGKINSFPVLDQFTNLTRSSMERTPSQTGFPNLFYDFTMKKCDVMKWAFEKDSSLTRTGILFCDADIFWLGPLPKIPSTASLALSQHMIRPGDEAKYGTYNAGFLWIRDPELIAVWKNACKTSRFFEQAALEQLIVNPLHQHVYQFGIEYNYGWWRLYQSDSPFDRRKSEWTIKRDSNQAHSGILVQGHPLSCIHTHWETDDFTTKEFNNWVLSKLSVLKGQPKVQKLISFLVTRY